MATTTAPSVSSGGSSQTIALAYAVAALQRGSDPLEARDLVHNSFFGEVRATDKKEPQMTSEQLPGSGTDSYDDRGSVTSSKSQNEVSGEDEEDAEKRLARSRERNREHARRTRLRKKAQLEALQSKVKGLEAERQTLRQQIEECSIASILLGLSSGEQDQATQNLLDSTGKSGVKSSKVALLAEGNRKRFVSDALGDKQPQPLKLHIGGRTAVIGGGKSHVNWKTGVYVDGAGVEQQLTPEELESLRRERNRMHAKMTRDRKKCFIATIQKTIEELESDIYRMKAILAKVASSKKVVTPMASPMHKPLETPPMQTVVGSENSARSLQGHWAPPLKRVCHGFSLDG